MLQPLLQEYLIENGNLPLPGTGQLTIRHTPAILQEVDKTFIAPVSKIVFSDTAPAENELHPLMAFIARKLSLTNNETKTLLEKEFGLNTASEPNNAVNWRSWNLFRDNNDDLNLSQFSMNEYLPSFAIEKIFRQPVSVIETVIQPTEETTEVITEFEELVAKDYWWVWALVIFIVSVLLIAFRYV